MPKGKSIVDEMSPDSRVWIYQSDRELSNPENTQLRQEMVEFVENWSAHGNELMAGCTIVKRHFLIIALDESNAAASGCSIDSCVRKIQELGLKYRVDFFQRTNVAIQDVENEIHIFTLEELKVALENGEIANDSLVYVNTIQKLSDLKTDWIVPIRDSWLKKYFK